MRPSEKAIERAIADKVGSPGWFQLLAERVAELSFPDAYRSLIPPGRNPDLKTRKGWPDAYSLMDGGRLAILEATAGLGWAGHLDSDIRHLESMPVDKVGAFVFVSYAEDPKPEEILPYQKRVLNRGVPPERILLLFRKGLIRELSKPRYAATRLELLGLPCSSAPFEFIEKADIYALEDAEGQFAPTLSEIKNGLVHRPALADMVEEHLAQDGWAVVRGIGASGKTILAALIALTGRYQHRPVYYLDLTPAPGRDNEAGLFEVITSSADEGVLFIIDNGHLDPRTARRIYDHWQENPAGSRLLMLARWVEGEPNLRGTSDRLEEVGKDAFALEAGPDDFLGVYRRLARRAGFRPDVEPSTERLEQWAHTFGGDLICFSAAVSKKLRGGEWPAFDLTHADAKDYVYDLYVKLLTELERQNLRRVAALGMVEVMTPREVLSKNGFELSLQQGLVHRTTRGRSRYVYYRLVHPGLGALVLEAIDEISLVSQIWQEVASEHFFTGFHLARLLALKGRPLDAAGVLRRALADPPWPLKTLNVFTWRFVTELSERLGVTSAESIDRQLVLERVWLAEGALRTPLHFVVAFQQYAKRALPGAHEAIRQAFEDKQNHPQIVVQALRMALGDVVAFQQYAKDALPGAHRAVRNAFENEQNHPQIVVQALRMALGDVVVFQQYAKDALPGAHRAIRNAFEEEQNHPQIVAQALRAPVDHLTAFLKFARENLPTLSAALNSAFDDPNWQSRIAESIVDESGSAVVAFLENVVQSECIVARIDIARWEAAWGQCDPGQPDYFPNLVRFFLRCNRPELARVPATRIISTLGSDRWGATLGLHHVSFILRSGREAGPDGIVKFLHRINLKQWLPSSYQTVHSGLLAASLFPIWAHHDSVISGLFSTEALSRRIVRDLRHLPKSNPERASGELQLFGVGSLLGLPFSNKDALSWPDDEQLAQILRMEKIDQSPLHIATRPAQLWVGLHEMVRLSGRSHMVSKDVGEQSLFLWETTEAEEKRLRALNCVMVAWLTQCAAQNWRLVASPLSLSELVNQQLQGVC